MNKTRALALLAGFLGIASFVGCVSDPKQTASNQFVGSEKCGSCHQPAYASWKASQHAKMVRPVKEGLLKDALDNWAKDSKGQAGPTKGNIDGKAYRLDDVVYVIGSKWKQRYLVKNPATGNHQFMDKQWNRGSRLWEGYGQRNDWETQCSTCHATGFRITSYDPKNTAAMKVSMSEHNTGCEACHGPGGDHVAARGRGGKIFNPAKATKAEADKVCGYCHIRAENYNWRTAQGNVSEHLAHPVLGDTYKAGQDDWTKWYPDKLLIPGVHPEDSLKVDHPKTDLANAFFIDDAAQKSGYFEARKHHEQYQEHLQSKHAKQGLLGCSDCHSSHVVKGETIKAGENCKGCHDAKMDYKVMMPGLGQTAGGLFMRSHTFNPNPRKGGLTADQLPAPVYAYPQK